MPIKYPGRSRHRQKAVACYPYPPRPGTWVTIVGPQFLEEARTFKWATSDRSGFGARDIRRATLAEVKQARAEIEEAKVETRVSTFQSLDVPPISVVIKVQPTAFEGGSDGGPFGDVLVQRHMANGNRFALAELLRDVVADIAGTIGDPIVGAEVLVLMRRPR